MNELKELIKALRPVQTKIRLIRVGGANDGGYLIPDDLEGIAACFSPGVADITSTNLSSIETPVICYTPLLLSSLRAFLSW